MIPEAGEARGIWLTSPPMSTVRKPKELPDLPICPELLFENVNVGGVTAVGIKQLNLLLAELPLVQLICATAQGDTPRTMSNIINIFRSIIWFTFGA